MQVLSENWKQNKYPVMGMDPYEVALKIQYHEWPMTYPLNEATSVMEDFCNSWMVNDMVVRAVVKGEDFDQVIDYYQKKLEEMVFEAYGK
jgi:3-methyladenine DNA glycosylase AlkD